MNGAIVEFHGLAEAEATDNVLYQPPVYMLVKLLRDPGMEISIPPLQPSVVPIKTVKFMHNRGHGRSVTLEQFPITLTYAITDYKCQGKTFESEMATSRACSRAHEPSGLEPSTSSHFHEISSASRAEHGFLDSSTSTRPARLVLGSSARDYVAYKLRAQQLDYIYCMLQYLNMDSISDLLYRQ